MADELKHYGMPRRSGRYPWGSGDNGYQRGTSFRGYVNELKKQGLTETQIAEGLGMKTTQLRAEISLEKAAQRKADSAEALRLKEKGYSNVEIGKRMGINESSVRNLLDPVMQERALITENTADMLKKEVESKKYIDVGAGVENHIGVSRDKLNVAIAELKKEGYKLQYISENQLGTGKKTTIKVLTKDDVTYGELYKNKADIKMVGQWTENKGRSYLGLEPVQSVSSDRVKVRYAEDGGNNMDGVIELRRGVADISLGDRNYAQVRIAVDGTHYLKGMAIYSDDLPAGVDILFNTNKSNSVSKMDAMKAMKDDPDNPFGATVRQKKYIGPDGKEHLSAINIVNEEGNWEDWSKTLSSQVLSKQAPKLAKQQLNLALKEKQEEFAEYNSLTNPTIKRKLLESFADDCDSSAVHLKAAAMPRQSSHVILPSTKIKPTEIYAPNYINGETVVLIRHPHGGIFEIPELKVNNKNPDLKSTFGKLNDAVVIHPDVAKKLSGADFDGDTVLVIPNNNRQIATAPSIKGLSNFDPRESYPGYPGMKTISAKNKQTEMGKISNLITDMTIQGAEKDEIARAVKHSMVVIDAEKHNLNYKQSFIDNNIADLKKKYQGGSTKGASTLISKSKSEYRVDKRKEEYAVDPNTGKKIFAKTGEVTAYIIDPGTRTKVYVRYPAKDSYINDTVSGKSIKVVNPQDHPYYVDKNSGQRTYVNPSKVKVNPKQTVSTRMYETDDAFSLSSGTTMESIYATYANSLKALGDKARKEAVNTPPLIYSPSARKTYAPQVESLLAQLSLAVSNKPLERQALLIANKKVSAVKEANPDLTYSDLKKVRGQALAAARFRVGAKKTEIAITPLEWEAIQAGAISNSVLSQILNNTNMDLVKQYATPRTRKGLSATKLSRARAMFNNGYTQAEVARSLGISVTTLMNALGETVRTQKEGGN